MPGFPVKCQVVKRVCHLGSPSCRLVKMATKRRENTPEFIPTDPGELPPGYSKAQVMTKLGISRNTLQRKVREGELTEVGRDEKGRAYYDPEEVDALIEAKGGGSTVVMSATEFMGSANTAVLQNQRHIESLMQSVTGPGQKLLELLAAANSDLAEENRILRKKNMQMMEAYENILNQENERQILIMRERAAERRQEKAWDMMGKVFKDNVPVLMEQLGSIKSAGPVMEILGRIIPDQLEALEMANFITPEQKELILKVQKKMSPERFKALQAETTAKLKPEEAQDAVKLDDVLASDEELGRAVSD
jgi:predicted site-specific integrase-resolvase